jgi:hypothetical protein
VALSLDLDRLETKPSSSIHQRKIMKKIILSVLVLSTLSLTTFGATKAPAAAAVPAGGRAYQSAGCGFGSMLFKDEGGTQILAATTNGTSASQTFGISTGTLNCPGLSSHAYLSEQKNAYVQANFDRLSQEMAQGSGEHVTALANLVGCKQNATEFSALLKQNYRTLSTANPESMLKSVEQVAQGMGCSS